MSKDVIEVMYHANYNGASIVGTIGGQDITDEDPRSQQCIDTIVTALYEDCDEDGYFCGDWQEAANMIVNTVIVNFGADVDVVTHYDEFSS